MDAYTQYLRLILIFLAFVFLLLIWQGYSGYRQFQNFHLQLSERSVTSTAREIHALMKSIKSTVSLFAKQENKLLLKLLEQPGDLKTQNEIKKRIDEYFPQRLAFLLADKNGVVKYNHAEQYVGETCRHELVSYAENKFQDNPIFVHLGTQINSEHFDVLTPIQKGLEKAGIFFINFRLKTLRRVLTHGEVVDHHLLLLYQESLISEEFPTSKESLTGKEPPTIKTSLASNKPSKSILTKIDLRANPFYLENSRFFPESLRKRIFYSGKIDNTLWNLVDIPDESLFTKEYKRLIIQSLVVLSVFLFISGLLLWILKKEDFKSGKTRGLLAVLENERRRIAMDMHDQVLSELSHISREARQLVSLKSEDSSEQSIVQLQNNLGEVTKSIRSIINDLHPHILDNLGLESALRDCLQKHLKYHQSPSWVLEIDGNIEPLLSNEQRFNLYRIILEILNNIQKHAKCSHFFIRMCLKNQKLNLVIIDDGVGFNNAKTYKGLGLANIETRSRLLNAEIHWNRQKNHKGSKFELLMKLNKGASNA